MEAIILGIFSFSMVLLCIVLIFFVLMQKPNADAGMGASLGGGAAETAFGGEASNILTKFTVRAVVLYFVLAFCLYLGYIYASDGTKAEAVTAPTLEAVASQTSTTEVETPAMQEVKTETAPVVEETKVEETKVEETKVESPVEAAK